MCVCVSEREIDRKRESGRKREREEKRELIKDRLRQKKSEWAEKKRDAEYRGK